MTQRKQYSGEFKAKVVPHVFADRRGREVRAVEAEKSPSYEQSVR